MGKLRLKQFDRPISVIGKFVSETVTSKKNKFYDPFQKTHIQLHPKEDQIELKDKKYNFH